MTTRRGTPKSSSLIPIIFCPLSNFFDRSYSSSCFFFVTGTTPLYDASNTIGNLFSPNPNDTHSGRTTPSSIGGATSDRTSVATVTISGVISFDVQLNLTNPIHPIACQGSWSILDPDVLTTKNLTGREKGASAYTTVEYVALLSIISEIPKVSILVKACLSGRLFLRAW
jgi:hypothetical protein